MQYGIRIFCYSKQYSGAKKYDTVADKTIMVAGRLM